MPADIRVFHSSFAQMARHCSPSMVRAPRYELYAFTAGDAVKELKAFSDVPPGGCCFAVARS